MKLYRVETLDGAVGLWYNRDDQSESNVIHTLGLTSKNLPMEFDGDIAFNEWRSAAETVEQLRFWFTKEDLLKLIPLGFNLYEIESSIVKEHKTEWYSHPLFQEKGVESRIVLDINILLPK